MSLFNYSVDRETMSDLLDLMERHRPKAMERRVRIPGVYFPPSMLSREKERRRYEVISQEKLQIMARLAKEGVEQRVIARRLGISQPAVSKHLCRMGQRRQQFTHRAMRKAA
jgi:DNA-binding NarL/FixJ family response regulator